MILEGCHPCFAFANTESSIGRGGKEIVWKICPTPRCPSTLNVDAAPWRHSIAVCDGARLIGRTPFTSPENHVMKRPLTANHRFHSHNVIGLVNGLEWSLKEQVSHEKNRSAIAQVETVFASLATACKQKAYVFEENAGVCCGSIGHFHRFFWYKPQGKLLLVILVDFRSHWIRGSLWRSASAVADLQQFAGFFIQSSGCCDFRG